MAQSMVRKEQFADSRKLKLALPLCLTKYRGIVPHITPRGVRASWSSWALTVFRDYDRSVL